MLNVRWNYSSVIVSRDFVGATPADQDPAKAAPNHNPNFIVDDATLKTGVESHVRFILDYPKVAEQVQANWKQKNKG